MALTSWTSLAQRKRAGLIAGVVVLLALAAVVGYPLLAPKASTLMREPAPEGVVVRQGAWQDGEPGHSASGIVQVVRTPDGGHVLRFEEYQATPGPDVYLYLTASGDARTAQEVESGLRVLVPGGADGGQATLRGDFNVPLPAGFDPAVHGGAAAWCDRFNVLFGSAPLV